VFNAKKEGMTDVVYF
jgi:hypothetical protein